MIYYAMVCVILLKSLVNLSGIVIYAAYAGCDPLTKSDPKPKSALPILIFFMGDHFSAFPGLSGLFIASIYAAVLR